MKTVAVGIFVLVPGEFKPQVSYYAHAVGLLLGVVSGVIYFLMFGKKYQSYERWENIVEVVDHELEYEALNAVQQEVIVTKPVN